MLPFPFPCWALAVRNPVLTPWPAPSPLVSQGQASIRVLLRQRAQCGPESWADAEKRVAVQPPSPWAADLSTLPAQPELTPANTSVIYQLCPKIFTWGYSYSH